MIVYSPFIPKTKLNLLHVYVEVIEYYDSRNSTKSKQQVKLKSIESVLSPGIGDE